jgi:hypothetical protein
VEPELFLKPGFGSAAPEQADQAPGRSAKPVAQ